jgi:hypothetical protein
MAIVKTRFFWAGMLAALIAFPAACDTASPPEIVAAAPDGTRLIFFKSSGDQADGTAAAVYETPPDSNDVRHRTLIIFGRKGGGFTPEVTNDKVIACSKCSQFHDDPFNPKYAENYVDVAPDHIYMEQADGGERPSTTTLDFSRKKDRWYVAKAVREVIEAGRYESSTERLPLPASRLVQDMDARWSVPVYLNAIVVNDVTGRFAFIRGARSKESLENSIATDCKGSDCRVLVRQGDGCMSLVRDGSGRSFGVSVPNPNARTAERAVAASKALAECESSGGTACKEIRTDCAKGAL